MKTKIVIFTGTSGKVEDDVNNWIRGDSQKNIAIIDIKYSSHVSGHSVLIYYSVPV